MNASINTPGFEERILARLKVELQRELDAVAEPIIRQALDDIQHQMRQRMGTMVIGLLETSYDVRNLNDRLVITVQVKEPK